ncbi:MAG: hypothetical protein ACAH80_09230 [Alphaproteobacteria bacterium]
MKPLHAYIVAFMIAAAVAVAPQPVPAQGIAGTISDAAITMAMDEALKDALSPNDKLDPARFRLSSKVSDEAKVLHPLIIKQLESIAGSNEYWTGAQFILYIAKSQAKFNPEKVKPTDDKKPVVTLVVFEKEKMAILDVAPQLTPGFPGNVQAAIINRIIMPNFRNGHLQRGIIDGTRATLMALQGAYTRPDPSVVPKPAPYNWTPLIVLALLGAGVLGRRSPRYSYYDARPDTRPPGGARGYW